MFLLSFILFIYKCIYLFIEGGNATTYFAPLGTKLHPHIINISNYQNHEHGYVFKLRVQVCGPALLSFTSQSSDDIVAIISHQGVQIMDCGSACMREDRNVFTTTER